jgi:heme/copper-type cytochrome/quinol oxidase subunit 1
VVRRVQREHRHHDVGEEHARPTGLLRWLTSTDHMVIGLSYLVTSFLLFCAGGLLALAMRTQLAQPNQKILSPETYNEFFTMHGSIMMYLFAVPFAFGLANYILSGIPKSRSPLSKRAQAQSKCGTVRGPVIAVGLAASSFEIDASAPGRTVPPRGCRLA